MYEQNFLVTMFRTFMKVVLVVSNAGGAVIGGTMMLTGAIVLMLLELYVVWFSLTYVENVMRSLIMLGALVLAITALGSLGTVYEGACGRFIIILYAISVLTISGIQIYVIVILTEYRQSKIDNVKFTLSKNKININKSNVTFHSLSNLPLFPGTLVDSNAVPHRTKENDPKTYEHIYIRKRKASPEHIKSKYNSFDEFDIRLSDFIDGRPKSQVEMNSMSDSNPNNASEGVKETYRSIYNRTGKGVVTNAFSFNLPSVISWFLPNILEPEDNKYAIELKPIVGALSRPLLYISLKATVMLLFYATSAWEILCLSIAIYLCITKTYNNENEKDIDEDEEEEEAEEEAEEEEEEVEEGEDAKKKI